MRERLPRVLWETDRTAADSWRKMECVNDWERLGERKGHSDRKRKERAVNYKLLWADVKWQRHCVGKRGVAHHRCLTHTHTHTKREECQTGLRERWWSEMSEKRQDSWTDKRTTGRLRARWKMMRATQKRGRCQHNHGFNLKVLETHLTASNK